jgi:hypothetical protein
MNRHRVPDHGIDAPGAVRKLLIVAALGVVALHTPKRVGDRESWGPECTRRRRPFVITVNGRAAAVIMSPTEFDPSTDRSRLVSAAHDGLADSEAGRVITDADLDHDHRSPRR